VVTQGIAPAVFQDLYHHFMTVSWPRLFGNIAALFLALISCLAASIAWCPAVSRT